MLAIRHARTAMRIARLRRVCALSLAAALTFLVVLSLPTVLTASTANAVGAGALRLEPDAASDAGATGPGESAADGASGGVDDGSAIPSEPTTSPEGAESSADAGVDATAVDPVEPGANADDADIPEESVEADGSAAGADPDESRGANGGLTSNSPGPEEQRVPSEEEQEQQRFRALRASGTALRGDDYPAKYKRLPWPYQSDNIWDEWNFAYRQCTSFVSWRLNSANGVPFSNQYGGLYRWGDAGQWADSARSLGIRVDTTPQVGAVAWSGPWYGDASQFGHVAWVADVLSDGRVVIEEYNAGWAGAYSTRVVPRSQFQGYIHIKDIKKSFSTTRPTVSGTPMVGGTLTASVSGWKPAPTSIKYRWLRDGSAISGATKSTYQPTIADLDAQLRVEVTGVKSGYTAQAKTSVVVGTILLTDSDGSGISDQQELMPWNSDVNGDGKPDAVGFSSRGVQVGLSAGSNVGAPTTWVAGFGSSDGWSPRYHPRTLVDVNGDGRSDVVGFASDGVYVATSTGSGFTAASRWVQGFGTANGWSLESHPRTLADVNGDGLPDVVGFATDGVYVALGTGKSFEVPVRWTSAFGANGGWRTDRHMRWTSDMNGDGRDDIVGISTAGVRVALSTGKGFGASQAWSDGFGWGSGWSPASHPRMLADANGDGKPDVVGFATDGVYVAANTGSGLKPMTRWSSRFGTSTGWVVGEHPRTLADVDGDGRADVVGFADDGVYVSLSTGSSYGSWSRWTTDFNARTWSAARHARVVTDATGDGKADVVAFGEGGLVLAKSTGSRFGAAQTQFAKMGRGSAAGGWTITAHPRAIGVQRIAKLSAPTISGAARVGSTLTASAASPQPAPVQVTYQWRRNGTAIAGATSRSYKSTMSDTGKQLSVTVTARKFGYAPTSMSSVRTNKVVIGAITGTAPRISGTLKVGKQLTASSPKWSVAPDRVTYQWMRDGAAISGGTSSTYTLRSADQHKRISVTAEASKLNYTAAKVPSAQTARIGSGTLASARPKITGTTAVGQKLRVDRGKWSSGVTFSYQWYRDGRAITGATKSTYTTKKKDWKHRLTVRVKGAKTGYFTAKQTSPKTAKIRSRP